MHDGSDLISWYARPFGMNLTRERERGGRAESFGCTGVRRSSPESGVDGVEREVARKLNEVHSVETTEACAFLEGLHIAKENSWQDMIIEGDSIFPWLLSTGYEARPWTSRLQDYILSRLVASSTISAELTI
ncbi:hypothetical protein V6N11_058986 [Hibiscus sabdariffa]|uniref:RNase H type-1 domain-containing protein n=1 Tax=Hibiscus sabdariffa TaxID=183260 RepID=A0ABR2U6N0_9ROSI